MVDKLCFSLRFGSTIFITLWWFSQSRAKELFSYQDLLSTVKEVSRTSSSVGISVGQDKLVLLYERTTFSTLHSYPL